MMTDTDIIIEVAKLDGLDERYLLANRNPDIIMPGLDKYLTSRDAIIPVIEKVCVDKHIYIDFDAWLQIELYGFNIGEADSRMIRDILTATPRQFCIALLKATGNWKE